MQNIKIKQVAPKKIYGYKGLSYLLHKKILPAQNHALYWVS